MYTYRLVETTWRNHIEYEDGHGSLEEIVPEKFSRVIQTWEHEDEDFALTLERNGIARP